MNTISELLRLRKIWQLRLHPDHVAVGCVSDRTVDSALAAALVPVVTFTRSRGVPVEVNIHSSQALCDGTCF